MTAGAKSPLFTRRSPGGLYVANDEAGTTGNLFWVDSGNTTKGGDTAGHGSNPDAPFLTIDFAIGQCTSNNGDRIYVMPGHAENITTATGIACDVIGVEIIGIGHGASIPTISFTATAGSLTISVASVTLKNLKFVANFAGGITAGLTLAAGADNCILDGLIFRDTTTDKEFLIHVTVATTVDELVIQNCNFITLAGTMSSSVFFAGTTSNLLVQNNFWHVDCSASVVDHLTDVPTACFFRDNDAFNVDTGAGLVFGAKSDGVATGVFARNTLFGNNVGAEPLAATNDYMKMSNDGGNTLADSGRKPHPAAVTAVP